MTHGDESAKGREDSEPHPGKTTENVERLECWTMPEYSMTDTEAYDSLRKIGQTKPNIPPGNGVTQFASMWALINVRPESKGGHDGDAYVVVIHNEYTLLENGELAYRIGFVSLSKTHTQNEIAETQFLGYWDSPKILEHLLDFVCAKAGQKRPERISPREQFAPKTTTYYGSESSGDLQTFSELAKSARPSPAITESPIAQILIAPVKQIIRLEDTYRVELFADPGLMRISVEITKFGRDRHSRALGYVNNKSAWLSLRKRLQNTPALREEGMDGGPSPSNRNSGPSELRDRQSPEKKIEQGAAGQPATRSESKPERNQKPQPKSEGRSR